MLRRLVTYLTLCLVSVCPACAATVVRVDADAPGPAHNGTSWATAYTSIGQALSLSADGADIWVAEGVYREAIVISSYHKLYGGFIGYETSVSQRLTGAFRTIIDARGKGRAVEVAVGKYATLDGFTIRNGQAQNGGGIYCHTNTTTQILNCRIENCRATQGGGGIFMDVYSYGNLINCVFTHNRAAEGGGLYIEYHSYPVIRSSLIVRNHASVSGGGVYGPFHAGPDFEYCTVAYNSAEVNGGGAYDYTGSPMMFNYCVVAFNSAPVGGGFYGDGGTSSLSYAYTDLYGNIGGDTGGYAKPLTPTYGSFSADPLFLMPERDEFRLQPGSPAAAIGAYPVESPCSLDRIGIAGLLPDGTQVKINRVAVTAVDGGTTYLQSPDRSGAIAAQGLSGLHAGDVLASVTGAINSGGSILSGSTSVLHAAGVYTPDPLGTTISALGSTVGLRVRVWGRATSVTAGGFTLSDGGANVPVRWTGTVSEGSLVSVIGVYTLNSDLLASQLTSP